MQATIMGNFPTAAELKLPKTKQRGKIYSLVESMRWWGGERRKLERKGGGHWRERDRGRGRERDYKTMRKNFFQKYSPVTSIIILPFLTSCDLSFIKKPH